MIYSYDLLCIGGKKEPYSKIHFLPSFQSFFSPSYFLFLNFFYSYYLCLPFIQDALCFPFRAASTDHFFMSGEIQLLLLYSNIWLFLPCIILTDWHWPVFLAYQYCTSVLGEPGFQALHWRSFIFSFFLLTHFFMLLCVLSVLPQVLHWCLWIQLEAQKDPDRWNYCVLELPYLFLAILIN